MPAIGNMVLDKGYDAAGALVKRRFVKFSADEQVTPVSGIADAACGVTLFDVATAEIARGKGATVRMEGIAEVEVGATPVVAGNYVQLDAVGRVVPVAGASGARIVGQATIGGAAAAVCAVHLWATPTLA